MSHALPNIPAAHGLPDCVQLCNAVAYEAREWRLLAACGHQRVFLQPLDAPEQWVEVAWSAYEAAITAMGVRERAREDQLPAPVACGTLSMRCAQGFIRASHTAVIEHLLRPQEA